MVEITPTMFNTRETAALLLKLAGPGRVSDIESGTGPLRFVVPDDIAQAYQAFLAVARAGIAAREAEEKAAEESATTTAPKRGRRTAVAKSPGTGGE